MRVSEYTNATHTGLVALGTHTWCQEIFRELGLDLASAPEIVPQRFGGLGPSPRNSRISLRSEDTRSHRSCLPRYCFGHRRDSRGWRRFGLLSVLGTWSLVGNRS